MLLLAAAQRCDHLIDLKPHPATEPDAWNLPLTGPAVDAPAVDTDSLGHLLGAHQAGLLRLDPPKRTRDAPPDLLRVQHPPVVRGALDDALRHRGQHLKQNTDLTTVPGQGRGVAGFAGLVMKTRCHATVSVVVIKV